MDSILRVGLAATLALVFAFSERAGATPDDVSKAKMKALYESGKKHYNLSEFQDALNDYKEAYRIRADPVFLFNIAQCFRQLNDPAAAAKHYRAFLREAPSAPNRAAVEKLIEDMDKAVQERRITQPPLGTEPPGTKDPGSTTANEPTQPETPPSTEKQPEEERPPFYKDIVGDVLVIAGVLVVGAGVGLIVGSSSLDGQANMAGLDLRQRESAWSTAGTLAATSYAAFGVGAVLVAAGVVKWVTRPKGAAPEKVGWNVDLAPGRIFAGISGEVLMRTVIFGLGLLLVGGCRGPLVVTCADDTACVSGMMQGKCLEERQGGTKYCAFSDSGCPMGMKWDATAGDGLGGACVGGGGMGGDGGAGDMAMVMPAVFTAAASPTQGDLWGVGGHGDKVVYVVGPAGIFRSEDGGLNWATKTPPDPDGGSVPSFVSVLALSDLEAFVVGDYGALYHTTDGGSSWEVIPNPATDRLVSIVSVSGVLYSAGFGGLFMGSGDGGKNWMAFDTKTTSHLNSVWGSGLDDLYVVGVDGLILHSTDMAQTWSTQGTGVQNTLYSIWGAAKNDIHVVGEGGIALHSIGNGGWSIAKKSQDINMNYPEELFGVWGSGANDVYAVGAQMGQSPGGQIWRTGDQGNNWTLVTDKVPLLNSIWGSGPKSIFAAGPNGAIEHGQ